MHNTLDKKINLKKKKKKNDIKNYSNIFIIQNNYL